jgi:hypothetical protein
MRILRRIFDGAQGEKPAQPQGSEISKLVGDWFGESVCVNKRNSRLANDEHVVYHVTVASGKTNHRDYCGG